MPPEELVRRAIAAFNQRDVAGYTAVFAHDAVLHDPSFPEPTKGRAALAAAVRGLWSSFSDVHWELDGPVVAEGNLVAYSLTIRMTHDGPLPMPDGSVIEATGEKVSSGSAVFWRLEDEGLVIEERSYFDATGVALQLGLVG